MGYFMFNDDFIINGEYLTIGFSGKIASGKSTTSQEVMNKLVGKGNYKKISFADALRSEVQELLNHAYNNTLDYDYFDYTVSGDDRDKIIKISQQAIEDNNGELPLSTSRLPAVRELMQYWGTSVRRKNNNNYWIDKTRDKIRELHLAKYHVVIDDTRFYNEATFIINQLNSLLIRLDVNKENQKKRIQSRFKNQPEVLSQINLYHISETELDDFPFFDIRVNNDEYNISEMSTMITEEIIYKISS